MKATDFHRRFAAYARVHRRTVAEQRDYDEKKFRKGWHTGYVNWICEQTEAFFLRNPGAFEIRKNLIKDDEFTMFLEGLA